MGESRTKPSLYVESTIPSYLGGRPSPDAVVHARQQLTRAFWSDARTRYELFVSEAVLEEIRHGDPSAAVERLRSVEDLPVLARSQTVNDLAEEIRGVLSLPERARADALHLAFAVFYELDYLLTWNLPHLANAAVQRALARYNDARGLHVPLIVVPETLMD
jgi:predicted nucleic acid-binding protein